MTAAASPAGSAKADEARGPAGSPDQGLSRHMPQARQLPYGPSMLARAIPVALLLLLVSGCTGSKPAVVARKPGTGPSPSTKGVGSEAFWRTVEDARKLGGGDPATMAEILEIRFAGADDQKLRAFQRELVAVSLRLYTWRHWDAAEMICGFVSDDVFTDFRSWVITLGRETYTRIAANPDNLADVADLARGCEGAEFFGAAISGIYVDRHGFDDEDFPFLEELGSPSGKQVTGDEAVRRTLPRLAARIPDDGLGKPPGVFV
jgi:hypothetical protein